MGHPVAERYAEALFELATAENGVDAIGEALLGVRTSLAASDGMRRSFYGRSVGEAERMQVINDNLAPNRHPAVGNLLRVLVSKGRTEIFLEVVLAYFEKLEADQGILRITVETASELSDERRANISRKLSETTGKRVIPEFRVVPELIAGARLLAASRLLDGSVRRQLERLRSNLLAAG